jgi:nucleoid DNA-binding protein
MHKIAGRCSVESNNKLKISSITEKDVLIIWDALAYTIRDEMSKKRGVVLPGFGTFTFVEQRIDIGNKKQILKLKPFFLLSDKFAQTHSLQFEKDHVNTAIPVHRINYAAISELTKRKYSRDVVESVLNEAFVAIDHFVRADSAITVPFNGLGVFKIVDVNPKPKKQTFFEFSSVMADYLPIY